MDGLEKLFEKARLAIAPTKKERLKLAAERSREFNERMEANERSMRMTPELLAKRCTL